MPTASGFSCRAAAVVSAAGEAITLLLVALLSPTPILLRFNRFICLSLNKDFFTIQPTVPSQLWQ